MITKITCRYSFEVLDFHCNDFGVIFNIGVSCLGMWNERMSSERMSSARMSSARMSSARMSSERMSSARMSSARMSSERMSSKRNRRVNETVE